MSFIDLHSHYTWGIDDGLATSTETRAALVKAKQQDISHIVVTPHLTPGSDDDITLIKQRINEFIALAEEYQIKGYCGCEVMLNHDALKNLFNHQLITINEGPYLLVEFNLAYKIDDECLARLYEYGLKYRIIIAHVERYFYKGLDLNLIQSWLEAGYYIQVNSSSFLGEHGSHVQQNAYELLNLGMIHLIGSDTHRSSGKRSPNLKDTYELLKKKYQPDDLKVLMYDHPLSIINGEDISLTQVKKLPWYKRRI